MGSGALVIVSDVKSDRAKRFFTSPPQWATIRSEGASSSKSLEKEGLSQVVMRAWQDRSASRRAGFMRREVTRRHWKLRESLSFSFEVKNEAKRTSGALITSRGRQKLAVGTGWTYSSNTIS